VINLVYVVEMPTAPIRGPGKTQTEDDSWLNMRWH